MKREELIKACKYYKGENENPFDWYKNNADNQFWEYEMMFCHKYEHGTFGTLTIKQALGDFLDMLFKYLGDRYESSAETFRHKYYKL